MRVVGWVLLSCFALCSASTTLQQAFFAAYNQRIFDGTWASLIGAYGTNLIGGGYCLGLNSYADYPSSPTSTCDLQNVLNTGIFRCGAVKGLVLSANQNGMVLLDTTNSSNVKGKIVDLYTYLGFAIAAVYGPRITIEWNATYTSPSAVLNAVLSGDVDAACGAFTPGAVFTYEGTSVPTSYILSLFQCLTYLENPILTTLNGTTVTDFQTLIGTLRALNSPTAYPVCTTGAPNGGDSQVCSATINQFLNFPGFACQGVGTNAFAMLSTGKCGTVWGGYPNASAPVGHSYIRFNAPIISSEGTFFRPTDYYSSSAVVELSSFLIIFSVLLHLFF